MTAIDITWLSSTLVLSAIGIIRFRDGRQPIGSLIVAVAMLVSAGLIVASFERAAQLVQLCGIGVAGALIIAQERWKRNAPPRG